MRCGWVLGGSLLCVVACGGKALDDGVDVGDEPGSAGKGAAGTFASGGASAGGPSVAGSASAGTPAAGGSTGTLLTEQCADFCRSIRQGACKKEYGPDCEATCQRELSDPAPCEALGAAMLHCFTPLVSLPGPDCSAQLESTQAVCKAQSDAYATCVGAPSSLHCSGSGGSTELDCDWDAQCSDGSSYSVVCKRGSDGSSYCVCTNDQQSSTLTLTGSPLDPCLPAARLCGFPESAFPPNP